VYQRVSPSPTPPILCFRVCVSVNVTRVREGCVLPIMAHPLWHDRPPVGWSGASMGTHGYQVTYIHTETAAEHSFPRCLPFASASLFPSLSFPEDSRGFSLRVSPCCFLRRRSLSAPLGCYRVGVLAPLGGIPPPCTTMGWGWGCEKVVGAVCYCDFVSR
jgi:hypothetical protein